MVEGVDTPGVPRIVCLPSSKPLQGSNPPKAELS